MMPTTIPITVTPEAAARIAELGMQAELEQMLEHTLQTVPGVRSIEVQEALPYDTGDETTLVIQVTMEDPHLEKDPTETEWDRWMVTMFPPDVCRYFVLLSFYANP
jgi:hypothetical protein